MNGRTWAIAVAALALPALAVAISGGDPPDPPDKEKDPIIDKSPPDPPPCTTPCGTPGQMQGGRCTGPEVCNNCDDNGDGFIDEGLVCTQGGGPVAAYSYDTPRNLAGIVSYDTGTDATNCGKVGTQCPSAPANGYPVCTAGTCGFACNSGYSACGSACYSLSSDVGNCGACGHVCPVLANATSACLLGACTASCNVGLQMCAGTCLNVVTDVNNCGSCGTVCTTSIANASPVCLAGGCSYQCTSGLQKCSTGCCVAKEPPCKGRYCT